jgi:GNAT superfamily N-acetyltransferase
VPQPHSNRGCAVHPAAGEIAIAEDLDYARCNQHDLLAGGLSGILYWDQLFVDTPWVDHVRRERGLGRELMKHAETYAIAKGCHSAWLDTFQAYGFYEKLSYKVFGALDDYPVGQRLTINPIEY